MVLQQRKISELKPYKKNAKKHSKEQIEQIAESIKEFGFTQPVLIDEHDNVVAGHGRILGAKKAGLMEVLTICLTELTREQVKAYRLIDNKLNESPWDADLLEEELSTLFDSDIDMELFGFEPIDEVQEEENKRKISFEVKQKHQVIVECENEQETYILCERLEKKGYECKVKNT